jgi:hypothetical protein
MWLELVLRDLRQVEGILSGCEVNWQIACTRWRACRSRKAAYGRVPPPEMNSKAKILAYGQDVLTRLRAWWNGPGRTTDFSRQARVYYGNVTLHEYLERTMWHSGQHVRQLMMVLDMLGIACRCPTRSGTTSASQPGASRPLRAVSSLLRAEAVTSARCAGRALFPIPAAPRDVPRPAAS